MNRPVVLYIVALLLLAVSCDAASRRRAAAANKRVQLHEDNPLVQKCTASNFRDIVVEPSIPVLMVMYNPDDSRTPDIVKHIDAVSRELEGVVSIVAVDGAAESELLKSFGVQSVSQLPGIVLFNPELQPVPGGQEGQLMKPPVSYEGDVSAMSIIKWILNSLPRNHIERIQDDHELADFFAKFSSLGAFPRFLYFTDASHVSPAFVTLTHRYRYGAAFGVVFANQSAEVQKRYGVTAFPSLLALIPAPDNSDEVIAMPGLAKDTEMSTIQSFVEQHVLPQETQSQLKSHVYLEEQKLRAREDEHSKLLKALPPIVITTKKDWVNKCLTAKKGLCYAVFVENVNEDQIPFEMLFNVSRKIAQKSSVVPQIAVIDGYTNWEIVNHFGIVNGLPDALVINAPKRTYTKLIGSVTERGLTNFFLDKAVKGVGSKAYKAKQVPKFKKTQAPVDEDAISDESDEL